MSIEHHFGEIKVDLKGENPTGSYLDQALEIWVNEVRGKIPAEDILTGIVKLVVKATCVFACPEHLASCKEEMIQKISHALRTCRIATSPEEAERVINEMRSQLKPGEDLQIVSGYRAKEKSPDGFDFNFGLASPTKH